MEEMIVPPQKKLPLFSWKTMDGNCPLEASCPLMTLSAFAPKSLIEVSNLVFLRNWAIFYLQK